MPFFLRTGKQLGGGERIISIAFREPPKSMFPDGSGVGAQGPDHLTFDLADSSKLSLSFYGKKPGPGMKLEKLSLQFALHETGQDADVLEAYERLIHDAMIGDHTLFNTAEGIERLWEVSTPLAGGPAAGAALPPGQLGTAHHQRARSRRAPGACPSSAAGGETPPAELGRSVEAGPVGPGQFRHGPAGQIDGVERPELGAGTHRRAGPFVEHRRGGERVPRRVARLAEEPVGR